jgi:hypothetical protein
VLQLLSPKNHIAVTHTFRKTIIKFLATGTKAALFAHERTSCTIAEQTAPRISGFSWMACTS